MSLLKKLSWIRLLILICILFSICLVPIIKIPFFYLSFEFPKIMIFYLMGIILFFLNGLYLYYSPYVKLPENKFLVLLIIFVIFYLIATFFSLSFSTSIFGLREIYTGGLFFILFLFIFSYSSFIVRKEKKILLKTLIIASSFVAFSALFQYLNHYFLTNKVFFRVSSTIGHPTRLAFYLLPMIFISFSFFLAQKNNLLKILFALFFLLIFLAFCLTFTRSSIIILMIVILIYFIYDRSKYIKLSDAITKIITTVFLIILFFFVSITWQRLPFSATEFNKSSLKIRLDEWLITLRGIIHRHPLRILIGNGPETIYFTYSKHQPPSQNQAIEMTFEAPLKIRNHYLNLINDIGLLGFFSYLLLITLILKNAYYYKNNSLFDRGIFLSLIGIIIHSVFYYQTENILLLFWLLAGLVIKSSQAKINIFFKNKFYLIILSIISSVLIFYWGRFLAAEILINTNNSLSTIKTAAILNPYDDIFTYQIADYYFKQATNHHKSDKKKANTYLKLALIEAKNAVNLSPHDRKNILLVTQIAFWGGINLDKKYHQEALHFNHQLIKLDPNNAFVWDQLGQIYLDMGELDKAMYYFNHAKKLNPNFLGVYLHIGEVLKQKGQIKEAIKQYEHVLKLHPNWDFAQTQLNSALKLLEKENEY